MQEGTNMKKVVIVVAVIAAMGVGFLGGMYVKGATSEDVVPLAEGGMPGGSSGGPGGMQGRDLFGDMTEQERTEFEAMSPEERQAFMQERFGDEMPGRGGQGGPGGPGGRGGLIDGEIVEVADDSLTIALADGGSNVVGIDGETLVASVQGSDPALAAGASVLVFSEMEAQGVVSARAIIVR